MSEFEKQLEHLINCHSIENESNTPDFILAEYLRGCLDVFAKTVNAREKWYGRAPKPVEPPILFPIQLFPMQGHAGACSFWLMGNCDCETFQHSQPNEGYCFAREDEQHCECWWDGEPCCSCNYSGITKKLDIPV